VADFEISSKLSYIKLYSKIRKSSKVSFRIMKYKRSYFDHIPFFDIVLSSVIGERTTENWWRDRRIPANNANETLIRVHWSGCPIQRLFCPTSRLFIFFLFPLLQALQLALMVERRKIDSKDFLITGDFGEAISTWFWRG